MKKLLYLTIFLAACNEKELIKQPDQYTRIYMPQATEYPAARPLIMADTLQTIIMGAAYGGVDDQPYQINVHFTVNNALVDTFNKKNNTAYLPMPAGSYQIDVMDAVINPKAFSSNALKIKVKTVGGLNSKTNYLLPVTLETATPSLKVNEQLRTSYFLIRADYAEYVRTKWKAVSVSSFESPNSGDKAWDGTIPASWHTQWKAAQPKHPHTMVVDMDTTVMLHGFYTLPSQVATGNPQNLRVELSTDGTTWTDATDFTFVNTYDKQYAYLPAPKMVRYYKITVLASFGATHFTHIAEWGAF
ncbi:DUF1735 domain-containing protein [Chitinophaga sp. SYP-B3965]|uniref:BT_3987 domain-containing protein n=1 Tax=Chitinophaga sp. SYP-B3965 TaxID=2663120 RepID=UPI0012997303|nr:DUF1735 domain-containing protein [Chitinophaga sp. SYP-B3965]MRG44168.1 DUF1735 domain-containing protein [Chitinophaga sp. SYP-B3965]